MKIKIIVKPNSKKGPLIEIAKDNTYKIFVKETTTDNLANRAVIFHLSKYFDVPKSLITIIRGQKSRHKVVNIEK